MRAVGNERAMRDIYRKIPRLRTLVCASAIGCVVPALGCGGYDDDEPDISWNTSALSIDPAAGVLLGENLILVDGSKIHQVTADLQGSRLSHVKLDKQIFAEVWWNPTQSASPSLVASATRFDGKGKRSVEVPTLLRIVPGAALSVQEYQLPDFFSHTQILGDERWAVSYFGQQDGIGGHNVGTGLQDPTLVAVSDLQGVTTKTLHVAASGASPLELHVATSREAASTDSAVPVCSRDLVEFSDGSQMSIVDLGQAQPHAVTLPLALASEQPLLCDVGETPNVEVIYAGVSNLAEVAAISIIDAPAEEAGFDIRLNLLDVGQANAAFGLVETLSGKKIISTSAQGFALTDTISGVMTQHPLPVPYTQLIIEKDDAGRDVRAIFWQPGRDTVALVDLHDVDSPLGVRPEYAALGGPATGARLLPAHRLFVTTPTAINLIGVLDGSNLALTTNDPSISVNDVRVFDDVLFIAQTIKDNQAGTLISTINLHTLERGELRLANKVTTMSYDPVRALVRFAHPNRAGQVSVVEFVNQQLGQGVFYWGQLAGGVFTSSIFGG